MVQHPEFKEADPLEKALVKRNCKEIFPITESLKANIKKRYDAQYRIHLEEEVRFRADKNGQLINSYITESASRGRGAPASKRIETSRATRGN